MKKIASLVAVMAILAISGSVNKVFAQQDAQYSMYMFNPLAVNPAYAGGRDRLAIVALYRDQWTGLDGAPRTFSLTAHAPLLNDRIGIGGSLTSDNIGVLNMINGTGDFSYRLPVGKGKFRGRLCFGLSASVDYYSNRLNETVIIDNGDPNFSVNRKATNMNFGAGTYFYNDKFYAGISMPHFLNEDLHGSISYKGTQTVARQYRHLFFTVGGMVNVSKNVKFKPSVMLKYVEHTPVQMDFNASFLFKEMFWVGASFRTSYNQPVAAIGMIEYMFLKSFRVGYAYDYTFTNIGKYTSGSHEIMVGYEFGKLGKYTTPRYMSYF